jgi:lincosamide nucleotidyltransferase
MTPEAHAAYAAALVSTLAADPDVVGVVLLGSSSGLPPSPDEFSDHDFFVVTRPGAQERFRTTLGWLPDAAAIALAFRETAHGMKVLYAGGHLVEFAAFDLDELAVARVNRYRVVLDRADLAMRMQRVHAATLAAAAAPDLGWHAGQFLTELVVGTGRDARGERLSGHQFIRGDALRHLLVLLEAKLPQDVVARLDDLDPYRRFELARPDLGREIEAALRQPAPATAKALLDIAARELPELVSPRARDAIERVLAGEHRSTT